MISDHVQLVTISSFYPYDDTEKQICEHYFKTLKVMTGVYSKCKKGRRFPTNIKEKTTAVAPLLTKQ